MHFAAIYMQKDASCDHVSNNMKHLNHSTICAFGEKKWDKKWLNSVPLQKTVTELSIATV